VLSSTDKLKVLQISPEFPPHALGGGGLLVQNLSRELYNQGQKITVLSGYYPSKRLRDKPFKTRYGSIEVEWFPLIPTWKTGFQLKTLMPPNLFSLVRLVRCLQSKDYDVVHSHGYGHFFCDFASLLCIIMGKDYLLTIHGFPKEPNRRGGLLKVIFYAYSQVLGIHLVKRAFKTVAVSKSLSYECLSYTSEEKIDVIANAVDLTQYLIGPKDTSEVRLKYNLNGKKILLCIGRLSQAKGFQFAIKSLPKIKKVIPDVQLIIVGKDTGYGYAQELEKIVREEKVENSVSFLMEANDNEKISLLWLADVLIIPSLEEVFGIVALEALAAGALIVASKIGGLEEILREDKYSVLVNRFDVKSIADNTIKLLSNPDLALRARADRFARVKEFDLNEMGKNYIKLYQKIRQKKLARVNSPNLNQMVMKHA
jgi:1,4-alpha-glucan branching enzyme